MKRKKTDFLRFVAELDSDISLLDDLTQKTRGPGSELREGVRPALLNRELSGRIDELRSFRHIFCNIYQSELDPKRVELVQQPLGSTLSAFKKAHQEFIKKIKTIAEQLED